MFCENCGKPLDDGTKFCLYCGAIQEEAETNGESLGAADTSGEWDRPASDFGDIPMSEDAAQKELSDSGAVQTAQSVPVVPGVKPVAFKPEKRRRKPMRVVPTVFICVLFSLLTFAFVITSSALWEVRSSIKNGSVSEAVSVINPLYLDAKDVVTDTKAIEKLIADIGIKNVEIVEVDDNETLIEWIERSLDKFGTTEDDIEQFLENSALMPYITEVAASYENYILTGDDDKPVTDKKIKATAVKCMEYISDEFGCKLASDYKQRIDKFLSENRNTIKAANPSKVLGENWSYIRYCISLPVIITVAVLALIFAALAGIITKRPDAAFITFGIPTLLSGALFMCVGLFPRLVLDRVNIPNDVIGDSVDILVASFVKEGAVEAVIGLVFIAAFIVYRVVATILAKKKALRNA